MNKQKDLLLTLNWPLSSYGWSASHCSCRKQDENRKKHNQPVWVAARLKISLKYHSKSCSNMCWVSWQNRAGLLIRKLKIFHWFLWLYQEDKWHRINKCLSSLYQPSSTPKCNSSYYCRLVYVSTNWEMNSTHFIIQNYVFYFTCMFLLIFTLQ